MTCAVDGCDKPAKSGRCPWCNMHYKRMRKTGTTDDPRALKPCAVDGCDTIAKRGGKGWCTKHYTRWKKYGDVEQVAFIVGDETARFWSKVDKNGPVPPHRPELGPCWVWTGGCDEAGYGVFYYTDEAGVRHRGRAHRWLLGHLRGELLSREVVGEEDACHRCDNPPCVRAEADGQGHLYVGTRKQNIADAVERGRLRQQKVTHCPQGHEYTYNPSGKHRRCKTCERETQRTTRTVNRTTCKNGHPLEGDNVLLCKNGTRKCRICDADRRALISNSGYRFVPGVGNVPAA